jgi:hypothetical protein
MRRPAAALLAAFAACGPDVGAPGADGESSSGHDTGSLPGSSEAGTDGGTQTATTDTDATDTGSMPSCVPGDGEPGTLEWSFTDIAFLAHDAAAIDDHDVVVIGRDESDPDQSDVAVERRDGAGVPLWSDRYAGAAGLADTPLDVAVDPTGHVLVLVNETILHVVGEAIDFADARLVLLRYAPDGSKVWRWERPHPPARPLSSYYPEGVLAVVDDRVLVLEIAWYQPNEPIVLVELDFDGNVESEVVVSVTGDVDLDARALGPDGGPRFAGDLEEAGTHALWVATFGRDGALRWQDSFGSLDDRAQMVLGGPDGETYLAWATNLPATTEVRLRRYDSDGTEAWTSLLPPGGVDARVAGALACDGALALTSGIDKPPGPDLEWDMRRDLWVAGYGNDGAPLWTAEVPFGPPYSYGEGHAIAAIRDGAAIVLGSYLDASGSGYAPWLGRFAG